MTSLLQWEGFKQDQENRANQKQDQELFLKARKATLEGMARMDYLGSYTPSTEFKQFEERTNLRDVNKKTLMYEDRPNFRGLNKIYEC